MLRLSAEKGAKCPCGKRAKFTAMSLDGKRPLMPCCPGCGLIALEYKTRLDRDRDAADQGIPDELARWYATDSGVSSCTILAELVPEMRRLALHRLGEHGADVPHDPDDFGRCYRLLKILGEDSGALILVSLAHPKWSGLVDAWDELTRLYENEEFQRLYERMKELGA
jgi:hypothetical protein